ncbi:MAG: hypothetical protein D3924_07505 [Candidatus Electrothrix sp. AR4]|nr:hypothetical protein [Candidatus Electrothrix sp. AR4]
MRLGFPAGSFEKGLCELSGDAPFTLFKDRRVLIQTQSSVTANSLIQQIDVWSQAIVDPKDRSKKT